MLVSMPKGITVVNLMTLKPEIIQYCPGELDIITKVFQSGGGKWQQNEKQREIQS